GEDPASQQLGLEIVARMRRFTDRLTEERRLNYSLLATPAEGLSGRFVAIDRERFGVISGVTDQEYYTNSFHIPVYYPISWYDKIALEGPYHQYCNGGHITYVEMKSPPGANTEALETLLRHMADCGLGYAGINFPIDFCNGCGLQWVFQDGHRPARGGAGCGGRAHHTGHYAHDEPFTEAK